MMLHKIDFTRYVEISLSKWMDVPCHYGTKHPQVADGGDDPQACCVAMNMLNMQSCRADSRYLPAWWVWVAGGGGVGVATQRSKKLACYRILQEQKY
jgi:hypothetical protein